MLANTADLKSAKWVMHEVRNGRAVFGVFGGEMHGSRKVPSATVAVSRRDAPIAQLAEAADLKSAKCRFESDWGHKRSCR